MFVKFTEKAQKALVIAESTAYHLCSQQVTTKHLLVALLKMRELPFTKLLKKYHMDEYVVLSHIESEDNACNGVYLEYSDELSCLLENAIYLSRQKSVGVDKLALLLLEEGYDACDLIKSLNIDVVSLKKQLKEKKEPILAQIPELLDLNAKVKQKEICVIGRDKELMLLVEMLCRKEKNNAIITGDAGVGKTALVEKLACFLNEVEIDHPLSQKRVYELDLPSVLAGTKYRGDFEEKLKKIILALKEEPHAIVFIDEIHNLVDAGKAEGAIDASNILKPYLARGEITCIGATTYDEYKKYFESDPALNRRFARIDLKEEKDEQIELILRGLKQKYEQFHHVAIEEGLLKDMISYSNRYLGHLHQPDKALDVLDLCCVKARMKKKTNISKEDVLEVVEGLCGYPLNQNECFEGLRQYLESHFVGQNKAIELLCEGLKKKYRHFIFLGPKGVGKTEMAKEMAKYLNRHLIHFHLYTKEVHFLEQLKRYPQSVLLVDDVHLLSLSARQMLHQLTKQNELEGVALHELIVIYTSTTKETSVGFQKEHPMTNAYIIHFEPFTKQAALEFFDLNQMNPDEELLDCPYEDEGARALIRRVQEKQSEKMTEQ